MITKVAKEFMPIIKWLATNTSKDKVRPALQMIHVKYFSEPGMPTQKITCEATTGFILARCTFENPNGINVEKYGLCPEGNYKIQLLSHDMVDWIEDKENNFPDTSFILNIKPELKSKEPISDPFIVSVFADPKLLNNIIPSFVESVQLCLTGSFIGFKKEYIEEFSSDESVSITLDGILMPRQAEKNMHFLSNKESIIKSLNYAFCYEQLPVEKKVEETIEMKPETIPEMVNEPVG